MRNATRSLADDLFARYRLERSPEDLARVYELTSPALLRSAMRLAIDAAAAEDALQQTFLLAIQHANRYDAKRPLLPWLHAILVNELRATHRRSHRHNTLAGSAANTSRRSTVEPTESAQHREVGTTITRAVEQLPEPYRSVLRLRLFEGLPYTDIATELDRPENTVRGQLKRGLDLLRRALPAGLTPLLLLAFARASSRWRPRNSRSAKAVAGTTAIAACLALAFFLPHTGATTDAAPIASIPEAGRSDARASALSARTLALRAPLAEAPSRARVVVDVHHEGRTTRPWVRFRPIDVANAYLHDRWQRVDSAGRASFVDVPLGRAAILLTSGASTHTVVRRGTNGISMRVSPGYAITGRVTSAGNAVANASVWLSTGSDDRIGRVVTETDSEGRFVVECVSGERYVGARCEDFAASSLLRASGHAGERVRLHLELGARGGTVSGTVRGDGGQCVAGARVTIASAATRPVIDARGRSRRPWPELRITTDAAGRFVARGIPAGSAWVSAVVRDRIGEMKHVRVQADAESNVDLRLERGAVSGRVTDASGRPLGGVRVGVAGVAAEVGATGLTTDAHGRFRLTGLPTRSPRIYVDGGRHGVAQRVLRLQERKPSVTWNPVLAERRRPIRGVLLDARGRPLAGWTIDVRPLRNPRRLWRQAVATGPKGQFAIASTLDEEHALFAIPPGVACPCARSTVRAGSHRWVIRVAEDRMPTASVRGRIADASGTPIADAEVTLTLPAWTAHAHRELDHVAANVADDASFARDGIPPGTYRLTVYAAGHRPYTLQRVQLHHERVHDFGTIRLPDRVPDDFRQVSVTGSRRPN